MATARTSGVKRTALDAASIDALRARLGGELLTPRSPGYDQAREVWNATIDRHPALIARCTGAADVIHSVRFARENGIIVSVRGGGHNIAGNAVCDEGIMIDLSPMRYVKVNPAARRADVGPGSTLGHMDRETQAFGLVVPSGINSTTGVAGLTLGGGFGWLSRKFGLTVDSLVSADVVTAEGKLVRASATENADLFWGIRGGGGNFGVVTNFEFMLHPFGPEVYAGLIVFSADEGRTVLEWYREFVETAPDELTAWAVLRPAPPVPFLPESAHGKDAIVIAFCYSGDPAMGEKATGPLRGFGKALGEMAARMPFTAWQQVLDPMLVRGARNYWKTHNFGELNDELITILLEHARTGPTPQCEVFLGCLGGQVTRAPAGGPADPLRRLKFFMNVHARWDSVKEDDSCVAWARGLFNATAPFATGGAYVNFLTQEEGERLPSAYGDETWKRLVALKDQWDPENFFCMNQNIEPTPRG